MLLKHLALAIYASGPVLAHSFMTSVTIGGKKWQGWAINNTNTPIGPGQVSSYQSIQRKIQTEGPIYIDSPWLAAGPVYDDEAKADADSPVLTADAQPEDEVTVRFARWWYDDHYGPITIYMAECSAQGCSQDDPKDLDWFKTHEWGFNVTTWKWPSQDFHSPDNLNVPDGDQSGNKWTWNFPNYLKKGQYMVRFEIIALHGADHLQYYPRVFQIDMKKDGDEIITPSDTGKFPDIYTAKTDRNRNVQYYNIWSSPSRTGGPKCKSAFTEYQVPGLEPVRAEDSHSANNDKDCSTSGPGDCATAYQDCVEQSTDAIKCQSDFSTCQAAGIAKTTAAANAPSRRHRNRRHH